VTCDGWLRALDDIADGASLADIAARCSVTVAVVRRWLEDDSVLPLGSTGRDVGWLRDMYVGAGRSAPSIAAELGVSRQRVCQWLDQHRIECRTTRSA
jgi:transposase